MSQDSTPDGQLAQLAQELLSGATAASIGGGSSNVESETTQVPAPRTSAPTMGNIQKLNYSHDAMIDLIIASPGISQKTLAARFGYGPSWVSNVMASDMFQARLAERRKEVIDPTLIATFEERVKGLTLQAMQRLQEKLEAPVVSDTAVLRAFELGAKAMGLGGNAAPKAAVVDLDLLAGRLLALKRGHEPAIEGSSERVVN